MRQILFPGNEQFWYETLRSFSHIAYGGADFGEVAAITGRITEGDYDSWYDAWLAAAERLAAEAGDALRAGHRASARDGLLRASDYYRSAEFFLHGQPGDPRHYHAYARSVGCFRAAAELFTPPVQPVSIPYEDTTLPGYLYRVDDSGVARPTLIMHHGFDGPAEELHFQGAAAAVERGYTVLTFDGPGHPGPRHHQGLVFRPDWENVVSPVVDFARTLPEVDGGKIALLGTSFGGLLAPRAAAFEHRLAAVIAVDGVYDMSLTVRAGVGDDPDLERRPRAEDDPQLDAEIIRLAAASPVMRWELDQAQWAFGPRPRARPLPRSSTTTCATGSPRRSPARR